MTPGKLDFSGGKVSFYERDAVRDKVWDLALVKWSRGYCPKRQL